MSQKIDAIIAEGVAAHFAAVTLSMVSGLPCGLIREEWKQYGAQKWIEGPIDGAKTCILVRAGEFDPSPALKHSGIGVYLMLMVEDEE